MTRLFSNPILTCAILAALLCPHPLTPDQHQAPASRGGSVRQMIQVVATAYTHTGHCTRSGVWPHVGVIATDPAVIPIGTRCWVEGYGPAVAGDTGGDIQGARIDEFKETAAECVKFGRRTVVVWVLK